MSANRLYQTIAAKLRKLIEDGEFPPGSRLPGERELAERFGVSRVTIREAEIALEAQGWIAIRIGSGVHVKPRPTQVQVDCRMSVRSTLPLRARYSRPRPPLWRQAIWMMPALPSCRRWPKRCAVAT